MPLKQKKPKVFADKMIILVSKKWQISPQKSKSNLRQIRPSRVILLKKAFLREIKSLIKTDLNNPAPRLRNRSESILKSTKIYYFQKILTFFFLFIPVYVEVLVVAIVEIPVDILPYIMLHSMDTSMLLIHNKIYYLPQLLSNSSVLLPVFSLLAPRTPMLAPWLCHVGNSRRRFVVDHARPGASINEIIKSS
jgi:hypothetical protein